MNTEKDCSGYLTNNCFFLREETRYDKLWLGQARWPFKELFSLDENVCLLGSEKVDKNFCHDVIPQKV